MRRRDFIRNTGVFTVGALTSGYAGVYRSKPFSDVNLGVIGTGDRGGGITRLVKDIEGMNILACSDIIPFRLEECMKNAHPNARAYEDYRTLIDDPNVGAIVICVALAIIYTVFY